MAEDATVQQEVPQVVWKLSFIKHRSLQVIFETVRERYYECDHKSDEF